MTLSYGVAPPSYRLPAALRLGQVRLQVAELTRSLVFYEEVLGLRVLSRTPTRATLGAQGDETPLVELHERAGARPVPRRGQLGLYHFAILLPDRPSLGRFVTHLAQTGVQVGMSDHAVSEAIYLTDPDGLGIEVYADRPRPTWQMDGRQIMMTTAPLDVRNVAQAAAGEPWRGMPAGTTLGHIHLHVDDLEETTAFYHIALGFDLTVWSYPGALFLAAGGYHHHLAANTWVKGSQRPAPGDAQLLEWELVLPTADDAAAAAQSLIAGGYSATPTDSGDWLAADPWGTTLRLRGAMQ